MKPASVGVMLPDVQYRFTVPLPPARKPTPTPSPTATASATPTPTASPTVFSIDLYRHGAFAAQDTTYYCVPASVETMLNLVDGSRFDTSRATQDDLYVLLRDYLVEPYWGRGAQPEGWARALTHEGGGAYEVAIRANRSDAVALAVRQLRLTGRPVGLLVWRGYHAWVMSGFTAIGDPATGDSFTVTGVYIEDPWWPRVSATWGKGKPPDTLLPVSRLNDYFLPYDQHGEGGLDKDGKYVVIAPTR